ncbi:hypothetical protein HDU96_003684 [Phlyctochytrium bullatum]|nr:hypothetical protein HDU96_003684 [Phlyctochytrium bullatum]
MHFLKATVPAASLSRLRLALSLHALFACSSSSSSSSAHLVTPSIAPLNHHHQHHLHGQQTRHYARTSIPGFSRLLASNAAAAAAKKGLRELPDWVVPRIKEYARRPLRQIAFSDMLKFGREPSPQQLLGAALFLADELPVRMAHRHEALASLPALSALPRRSGAPAWTISPTASTDIPPATPLDTLPSDIRLIQNWYAISFMELVQFADAVEALRLDPAAGSILSSPSLGRAGATGFAAAPSVINGLGALGLGGISGVATGGAGSGGGWGRRIASWFGGGSGGTQELATASGGASAMSHSNLATASAIDTSAIPSIHTLAPPFLDRSQLKYYGQEIEPHLHPLAAHLNAQFVALLDRIVERHNPIVVLLAKNVRELAQSNHLDVTNPLVQTFITKFFRSRASMRLLIGHHVALSKRRYRHPDNVGIVCLRTDAAEVAAEAAGDAAEVCEREYGVSPEVEIVDGRAAGGMAFVFVPSHLHHVLFEIAKNALRAVVEKAEAEVGVGNVEREDMEPVWIFIEEENETLLIRVSDRGTGIPSSARPHLFRYAYTTARPARLDASRFTGSETEGAPMAGFGYGLPLSRLYLRYFNGDLTLTSRVGRGTDVYLTMVRSLEGIMEPYI